MFCILKSSKVARSVIEARNCNLVPCRNHIERSLYTLHANLCSLVERFGGTCWLHHQRSRNANRTLKTIFVSYLISPRVNRQEDETDHSHPPASESKISGAIPPIPHTSSWNGA
jgi:hypothetical protein